MLQEKAQCPWWKGWTCSQHHRCFAVEDKEGSLCIFSEIFKSRFGHSCCQAPLHRQQAAASQVALSVCQENLLQCRPFPGLQSFRDNLLLPGFSSATAPAGNIPCYSKCRAVPSLGRGLDAQFDVSWSCWQTRSLKRT